MPAQQRHSFILCAGIDIQVCVDGRKTSCSKGLKSRKLMLIFKLLEEEEGICLVTPPALSCGNGLDNMERRSQLPSSLQALNKLSQ